MISLLHKQLTEVDACTVEEYLMMNKAPIMFYTCTCTFTDIIDGSNLNITITKLYSVVYKFSGCTALMH